MRKTLTLSIHDEDHHRQLEFAPRSQQVVTLSPSPEFHLVTDIAWQETSRVQLRFQSSSDSWRVTLWDGSQTQEIDIPSAVQVGSTWLSLQEQLPLDEIHFESLVRPRRVGRRLEEEAEDAACCEGGPGARHRTCSQCS